MAQHALLVCICPACRTATAVRTTPMAQCLGLAGHLRRVYSKNRRVLIKVRSEAKQKSLDSAVIDDF
ncbi:hypothetical protein ACVWW1_000065 [Bradyrhizobium sp. JR3.5]